LKETLLVNEEDVLIGSDVVKPNDENGRYLDDFVPLPTTTILENYVMALHRGCRKYDGFDVIICAAGGWQPSGVEYEVADDDDVKEKECLAFAKSTREMLQKNLFPTVATASVSAAKLNEDGLFVGIGATAALSTTPGMEGYGLAKAASHHLIQSLGKASLDVMPRKLLRQTHVGILPSMLDTPSNRKADGDADFSKWTKPIDIATEIGSWIERPYLRPASGSLVKVVTHKQKGTMFVLSR